MIKNEVYAGDILRQKCHIPDPISKKKVRNTGELPMYYQTDAHEAIIDRETYARVQAEIRRRESLVPPNYPFTGKITCGICGAHLMHCPVDMPLQKGSRQNLHKHQYPRRTACVRCGVRSRRRRF